MLTLLSRGVRMFHQLLPEVLECVLTPPPRGVRTRSNTSSQSLRLEGLGIAVPVPQSGWDSSPTVPPSPSKCQGLQSQSQPGPCKSQGPQSQSLRPAARPDLSHSPGLGLCVSWYSTVGVGLLEPKMPLVDNRGCKVRSISALL